MWFNTVICRLYSLHPTNTQEHLGRAWGQCTECMRRSRDVLLKWQPSHAHLSRLSTLSQPLLVNVTALEGPFSAAPTLERPAGETQDPEPSCMRSPGLAGSGQSALTPVKQKSLYTLRHIPSPWLRLQQIVHSHSTLSHHRPSHQATSTALPGYLHLYDSAATTTTTVTGLPAPPPLYHRHNTHHENGGAVHKD